MDATWRCAGGCVGCELADCGCFVAGAFEPRDGRAWRALRRRDRDTAFIARQRRRSSFWIRHRTSRRQITRTHSDARRARACRQDVSEMGSTGYSHYAASSDTGGDGRDHDRHIFYRMGAHDTRKLRRLAATRPALRIDRSSIRKLSKPRPDVRCDAPRRRLILVARAQARAYRLPNTITIRKINNNIATT